MVTIERFRHKEYICVLCMPISFGSKVTAMVKYFQKLVKSQGQGREVKDLLI